MVHEFAANYIKEKCPEFTGFAEGTQKHFKKVVQYMNIAFLVAVFPLDAASSSHFSAILILTVIAIIVFLISNKKKWSKLVNKCSVDALKKENEIQAVVTECVK